MGDPQAILQASKHAPLLTKLFSLILLQRTNVKGYSKNSNFELVDSIFDKNGVGLFHSEFNLKLRAHLFRYGKMRYRKCAEESN